jgi:hypothetical protein
MGFDFRSSISRAPATQWLMHCRAREEVEARELATLLTSKFKMFDDLCADTKEVAELRQLREEIIAGGRGDKWQVVDELITVASKVYMPATSPHLPAILSTVHDMGHEGTKKTLNRLCRDFYVPSAQAVVQEHVRACAVYQMNKVEHLHPLGLLQPLNVPSTVWACVHGFHRGLSARQQQVGDPHSRRPIF